MRHGSLFSGIGGFDLAAEWMGWENVFHCEWMEFPRKVLEYYWPNADSHIDICKTDFKKYANKIDILTGGFPCQPFSMAGKRKGTDDERYLWGEMLRAIQEIKPTYVIAENVFGITNIDGGLVFEQVCLDLEAEGYEVQPFIIPAAAKNAPHRRDRCWFIAQNTMFSGCVHGESQQERTEVRQQWDTGSRSSERIHLSEGDATNSNGNGQFKGWGYDGSSQNDERGNASKQWSANTKDANRCSTDGISQKQSTTCRGIGEQTNVKTNQTTSSSRICGMDKANNTKETIGNNKFAIDKSRALVSQGLKGVFTSPNRRLEYNKISFKQLATMGLSIDISRINTMEGNATNTNCLRYRRGNIKSRTNKFKEWKMGKNEQQHRDGIWCKIEGCSGVATNSNGTPTQCRNKQTEKGWKDERRRIEPFSVDMEWEKFPTKSPICGGDDGLPSKLDGITFSKWRAESIKGYGNAIVPQVAYEIFKQL